jgi:hypothetical protein
MSGYPCGHLQRTMVNFKCGPQVRANRGAMSGRANPVKAIILVSALWFATALVLADDSYFPIKTKAGGEGVTAFESKWYGKSLERMNEPRLPGFVKDVKLKSHFRHGLFSCQSISSGTIHHACQIAGDRQVATR